MKLCRLILLRLMAYLKKPLFLLALGGLLVGMWGILHFTHTTISEPLVLPIGVVDLDQTPYSDLITKRVGKKETISVRATSLDDALKQVSTGKLEAVYVLKEGLMEKILADDLDEIIEIIKSPVSLSAEIIGELFAAEVMRLSSNTTAANTVSKAYADGPQHAASLWQEAWDQTDNYWEPSPVITTDYRSTNKAPSSYRQNQEIQQIQNNLSELLLLSLLTFSILMASSSLLIEKDNGIIRRIISTGTPLWIYLLSSLLSLVVIHILGLCIIFFFTGQVGQLIGVLLLYSLYMVWAGALGLLILAFIKRMQQLLMVMPFVTLLNSLLILKLQGYNSHGRPILILSLLSISTLMVAISAFNHKVI